ncbi:hypothetical protein BKA70DRAFT_668170 [Coprinopsis sp. MPI-PUGE-AT-0042]|nr:hypothetical protein BKA70DRAFT_668170 [Coprinopsis sp. MPI-PUGE-AT-0042]
MRSLGLIVKLPLLWPTLTQARPPRLRRQEDEDEPDEDEPDEDEGGPTRPTTTQRGPETLAPTSSGTPNTANPSSSVPSNVSATSSTISTAVPPATSSEVAQPRRGISTGGIVGASIGAVIGLILIAMLFAACYTRRRRAQKKPRRISTLREFFRASLRRGRPQHQRSVFGHGVSLHDPPVNRDMRYTGTGQASIDMAQHERAPLYAPPGIASDQPVEGKGMVHLTYPDPPPSSSHIPNPHAASPPLVLHEDRGPSKYPNDKAGKDPTGYTSTTSLASNPPAYAAAS